MNYSHLEIAIECAWQIGDSLKNSPRAESRWLVADAAKRIIEAGIITNETDDIDEVIAAWIEANLKEAA
jgi:hypothetical protein